MSSMKSLVYTPENCPECGARYTLALHSGKPRTIAIWDGTTIEANVIDLDHPMLSDDANHSWPGTAVE